MNEFINWITSLISVADLLAFAAILGLNILSSCIGTLKTIFTAKQLGKTTYYIVLVDGIVYSLVLKSFSSSGTLAIIAYVLGKLIGTIVADYLENKMAIGIYEVTLYVGRREKMFQVQQDLIEAGYSSTATTGHIDVANKRYFLEIQIARKDMPKLYELLSRADIPEPTMVLREAKKVYGQIAKRI